MSAEGTAARPWDVPARTAFLTTIHLFADLPSPTRTRVAERLRLKRVERGGFVFLEGQPASNLSLLAQGRVKVIRETDEGREVILRQINPGEIFGAAGVWGEPIYPASARAQEDVVVLQLPAADFTALMVEQPDLALAVIRELAHRLREAEARIRDLQSERVERRLARALLRLANKTGTKTDSGIEVGVHLTRQDLAELAGTTVSTASRTLSSWDQQGIVEASREKVVIRRPHALVAIADDLPAR